MGLLGSGSGPLGSSGEAQRTYKTSAADAMKMAQQWYALAGVANPSPTAIAWWTKQIQEDGSQPAFDNFKNGKGQDAQSKFDPITLMQNVSKYTQQTGLNPYQPDAGQNQLPGTNYKNQASDATRNLGFNAGAALVTAGLSAPTAGSTGGTPSAASTDAATSGYDPNSGGWSDDSGATPTAGQPGYTPPSAGSTAGTAGTVASATGSGVAGTGMSVADILKMVGSGVGAYTQQQDTAAQLAERKREFDAAQAQQAAQYNRSTSDTEGNTAVGVQNRINTAPMADNAQALLMAKLGPAAAPTAFKPRDYTQAGGTDNLLKPATGGAQDQLAANQAASAAYKPGAGGVDTSTLQLLLSKLKGSAFGQTPSTSSTGATG